MSPTSIWALACASESNVIGSERSTSILTHKCWISIPIYLTNFHTPVSLWVSIEASCAGWWAQMSVGICVISSTVGHTNTTLIVLVVGTLTHAKVRNIWCSSTGAWIITNMIIAPMTIRTNSQTHPIIGKPSDTGWSACGCCILSVSVCWAVINTISSSISIKSIGAVLNTGRIILKKTISCTIIHADSEGCVSVLSICALGLAETWLTVSEKGRRTWAKSYTFSWIQELKLRCRAGQLAAAGVSIREVWINTLFNAIIVVSFSK